MKLDFPTYGYPEAAAAYAALRDGYLRGAPEPAGALDALVAEYPDYLPAHLLTLAKGVIAKDIAAFPDLQRALDAARSHAAGASVHERMHLDAADAWLRHRPLLAAQLYSTISAQVPADLLALRLAQSCWFFLGRRLNLRSVAERALRAWSIDEPGFDIVVALFAFGSTEAGDPVRGESLANDALRLEPKNPMTLHTLAHALGAQRRYATAARILRERESAWRVGGRLDSHIAWHLAVNDLENGHVQRSVDALDQELMPLAESGASASADATDLAWRLDIAGVDFGAGWKRLADAWARHMTPGFWVYFDVLAGMTYFRAGQQQQARELEDRIAKGPHLRPCSLRTARKTTLPALQGIESYAIGAFGAASSALRTVISRVGGSLLQRELFDLTLSAAEDRLRPAYARLPAALQTPA